MVFANIDANKQSGHRGHSPEKILAGVSTLRGLTALSVRGATGDPGPNGLKRDPPTKRGPHSTLRARSPGRLTICPRQ
ncbi:hypothetical protein TPY_2277 [Sulfobacillus acidophilus TPY]|nr:hypothetical protein TPY_2277 [Sulfobacillus acidophilus TPY]